MNPPMSPNAWLRYGPLKRILGNLGPKSRVLEIGCGLGAMTARLSRGLEYVAVEEDSAAARIALGRLTRHGVTVYCGRAEDVIQDERFDAVVALEVLEHIKDDSAALRQWTTWIDSSGMLVLSVPAKMKRFSKWDTAVGHYRRYELEELVEKLERAGLSNIEILSYGWPLAYLTESIRNRLAKSDNVLDPATATLRSGRRLQPKLSISGLFTWAATLPFRILQAPFLRYNWGTSFVAVARK